jgi:hypothetical protein
MLRKILGNNPLQHSDFPVVGETQVDQPKEQNQQLNQNINSAAIAMERKFTGSLNEGVLRRTLENQLQSNSPSSIYTPPNSSAQQISDTFSRMQEEYKKQQAEQKEVAKLHTAVTSEKDKDTESRSTIEGRIFNQHIVNDDQSTNENIGEQPSMPINSPAQQASDIFSGMEAAYKKQQQEQKETARLWAAIKPENPETAAINRVLVEVESAQIDQNTPMMEVNEIGTVSSEPLAGVPVNSPAQQAADIFSGMEAAYKKQQEEQKEAARLRASIVNYDHPHE